MYVVIRSNGNIVNLEALSHIEIEEGTGLNSGKRQVKATTLNGRVVLLGEGYASREAAAKSFKLRAVTKPIRKPDSEQP